MLTKKTLIIAAALVGAAAVVVYARRAQPPKCGDRAKWHVATETERKTYANRSGAVADSIRKFGGYCAMQGDVSEPYVGGAAGDDTGSQVQDSYLITRPSQLG